MDTVIEIRNVSKVYQLGESARMYGSFREHLTGALRSFNRRRTPKARDEGAFWALKNIDADIHKGDTVGIVGSNGAGKSTLLKIISRITDPSSGYIRVRGRVGTLLEVGTGFHPELSGRENIYLNGAILGMRKAEIDANFDAIVGFAGIGKFLDTPVKRYSSGMYVRLAFSIAAHLDPEILIVDEVLAVGDVAFQKKCLGKMAEACSRARTVLFVSHNLSAVESLCNRVIVLRQGTPVFDGPAKEGIEYYLRGLESRDCELSSVVDLRSAPGRPANYHPQLTQLELLDDEDQPLLSEFQTGAALKARLHFNLETPCTSFDPSIAIYTTSGQRVCTAHTAYEPDRIHEQYVGEQVFECVIPSLSLVPGEYAIHISLDIGGQEVDMVADAARLRVIRSDYYGTGIVPSKGIFLIPNRWRRLEQRKSLSSAPIPAEHTVMAGA